MRLIFLPLTVACLFAGPALAQSDPAADYPNHTVKLIVSVPPGGGVNSVTRIFADKLQQKFHQPFVIENHAGAAGNIGAQTVFSAEPDGYTLLASQPAPITVNASLYKSLKFDPAAMLPVAIMSHIANVLLVRNDFPAKTAQEFLTYVKDHPGIVNFASQGTGTTSHLTTELFMKLTGTKMVHVAYSGTNPAITDIVGEHVDIFFTELSSANKLHQGDRARILAVLTDKRLGALPDIPTMKETGVDLVSDTWNAISAPPKTPPAIVAKLNAAINDILATPEIKEHFAKIDLEPGGGSVEETAKFVKDETQRWSDVVHAAGIQPK